MSVVGASRWYDRVVAGQYSPESDLILNKYCRAFISEVKRLIPTEFYMGYTKHVSIYEEGRMKAAHTFTCFDGKGTVRDYSASGSSGTSGSLMPFGTAGECFGTNAALWLGNQQAHDSVSSWAIDELGRVMIKRACILAPSRIAVSKTQGITNATIQSAFDDKRLKKKMPLFKKKKPINLADLPQFGRGEFGTYFVVISSLFENANYAPGFGVPSSQVRIQGIMLRAVGQKSEETRGSRLLIPEGSFYMTLQTKAGTLFELPEECAVDWIVL